MDRTLLYKYWGKAMPFTDKGPTAHLLVYHSLDVAAVGAVYLRRFPALSRMFMNALDCDEEAWLGWASFWLALHDLGKFSEAFQSQKPEVFEQWWGRDPSPDKPYNERHDSLGQWFWQGELFDYAASSCWFGAATISRSSGIDAWMRAVTGHHGQPPKSRGEYLLYFSRADERAVIAFAEELKSLLLTHASQNIPASMDSSKFQHVSEQISWWFAGIAVLADWLGSNVTFFPYLDEPLPLAEYWEQAQLRAVKALESSGALPVAIKLGKSLSDFFPYIKNPSPLQAWAQQVPVEGGPQLHFLEDVTGAGKTEAALLLSYRLMEAGQAEGFFIGLPTMATANAMYERISEVYRQLFDGNPSLMLAHGSKQLVAQFARSILPATTDENDEDQQDSTASARCAAWLADHSKRALLSPAGVGTIDQALLAVLHSKHQSLRLLGLFQKVLVIDEVHACDAYMQKVLESLLEFHARAGGSTILLSATLPCHMKEALLTAFARGRGEEGITSSLTNDAYPLTTSWRSCFPQNIDMVPLNSRKEVCRTVLVHYCVEIDEVISNICNVIAVGGCVCWIRNTVADALEAFELLANNCNITPILFHARFTLADRLDRELAIIEQFGRESTPELRRSKLVIATQVIEQSLDVDFDLVVSDLAPIDRMLQRAGRMHRHVRNANGERILKADAMDARGTPRMIVFGPVFTHQPDANWYKSVFPKAAAVYSDHGQLWRTARELMSGKFVMPDDARRMIEAVFATDEVDIPVGLQNNASRAEGKKFADASIAHNNTLKLSGGYVRGDVIDWWSDARTPSRLGEASQSVVLARWVNGKLKPWAEREHAWAYSTIRVPERLIQKGVEPESETLLSEYQQVLNQLPAEGRWSTLVTLECNENSNWTGLALPPLRSGEKSSKPQRWLYDADKGLRLAATDLNVEELE